MSGSFLLRLRFCGRLDGLRALFLGGFLFFLGVLFLQGSDATLPIGNDLFFLLHAVIDAKGGAEAGLFSLVMTTDISTISPSTHTHNGAPGNHPNAEQHRKQAETLTAFLKGFLK